nr:hypothetical protein [Tanacetum cinerariifolium]
EIPRVGLNLEAETIILWWRYNVSEFIGELKEITPIGRRKWIDRKIKDERIIKRRIRMSSGTATTNLFNMIVIESFIFWKRNIRTSSGNATISSKSKQKISILGKELSKVLVSSKGELREVEEDWVMKSKDGVGLSFNTSMLAIK